MQIFKRSGNDQRGFGTFEVILIVLTLAGIGFVGYYTIQSRQEATNSAKVASSEPSIKPDPMAGWKTYESKAGKYTLKHPPMWYEDLCDNSSDDLNLYLGPTKESRVICNSEHGSQVMITSTAAVPTESEQTLGDEYTDKTAEKIKVDGINGERTSGKFKEAIFGLPAGTLVVRYFFLAPGRSYIASYVQAPSGDYNIDNLKEFDLMVQKSLTFTD